MPILVRRLPVQQVNAIVDTKSMPEGVGLFNPSYAHGVVSLRQTQATGAAFHSTLCLFREDRKQLVRVGVPDGVLVPTFNIYQGIEDVRLCWFRDRMWFTATSTHASHHHINSLLVGYLSPDLSEVVWAAPVDLGSRPVKNVCPFVRDGQLLLFDIMLRKVFRVEGTDEERGPFRAAPVLELRLGAGIPDVPTRGSTSPFHLHGNTWGFLVHDVIKVNPSGAVENPLSYIHHYGEVDMATGNVTFMSSGFFVLHWGVEFISGVHYDADKDPATVRLFIGVKDKEPYICTTTLHDLRAGKK